jgi:hypothetical protein
METFYFATKKRTDAFIIFFFTVKENCSYIIHGTVTLIYKYFPK